MPCWSVVAVWRGLCSLTEGTSARLRAKVVPSEAYAQRIFPGIISRQQKDGSWNGSVGSAFNTAMHVLCLTAPYEQAPMYQR